MDSWAVDNLVARITLPRTGVLLLISVCLGECGPMQPTLASRVNTRGGASGPPASSSSIAAPTSSASRRHTLGTMVSLRVWTWGTSLAHATLITNTATVSGCTFNTAHPGVQVAYHEIIGT